jgi:hypothetical protein
MRKAIPILIWLGILLFAGSIILTGATSRVGEQRSSTYGNAYHKFQNSWGGEIGVIPPTFLLERTYQEKVYSDDLKEYKLVDKVQQFPLIPNTINLTSTVNYGEQETDWLVFNAFEVQSQDRYIIPNGTKYTGKFLVTLTKPDNANLMYDYTIYLPATETTLRPASTSTVLSNQFQPGEDVEVVINYTTKGMDTFKYNLSAYQHNVVQKLQADIELNTPSFEVYRFGLPHEITPQANGAKITFDIDDFSTNQDLGITFLSKQMYLDQLQTMLSYSPLSLAMYLMAVLIFSQVQAVHFNAFHYLFIGIINVFYFLFVAYLIRFFGVPASFSIAALLTAGMFMVYCPNVFGWRFASRIAGPYLFALTVLYSLIFLMPVFQGLLFVSLVFLIFISIMIPIGRSDISKWRLVGGTSLQKELE